MLLFFWVKIKKVSKISSNISAKLKNETPKNSPKLPPIFAIKY